MNDKISIAVNNLLIPFQGRSQRQFEIEIRIGRFVENVKNGIAYTNFISSIPIKDFYRILNYFQNIKDYQLTKEPLIEQFERLIGSQISNNPQIYNTARYSSNDRNITIKEEWIDGYPNRIYTSKKNLAHVDILDYYSRIAKSDERVINFIYPGYVKKQIVKKERWSFITNIPNNAFYKFRIDITKVTSVYINNSKESEPSINYEIELEVRKDREIKLSDIYPAIEFITKIKQGSPLPPIWMPELETLISNFNKLFGVENRNNLYNVVVKPKNIKIKDLLNTKDLIVTDKADGYRKLLFVNEGKLFLIYPPFDVLRLANRTELENNSIFDGEFILSDFLVFDLLVLNGKDMRDKPFSERLKILKSINKFPKIIRVKEFKDDFYKATNEILDSISKKGYKNDGLIMNNKNDGYNKYSKIYKWKPIELLTIDFQILRGGRLGVIDDCEEHTKNIIPFKDFTIETNISENQIVECRLVDNKWEVVKVRNDREYPNNCTVAESIYQDIQNPITEKTIRGLDLVVMRKKHNIDKENLLQNVSGDLLDIGSGRGGDIFKWLKNSIPNVYAVEPNSDNLKEFVSRLKDWQYDGVYKKDKTTIHILQAYGQESSKILDFSGEVTTVSIFDALTFFFENEEVLDKLIETVENSKATKFIGIVMDGGKVQELLKGDEFKSSGWDIKRGKNYSTNSVYGKDIVINIEDSIVTNQREFLVDFETLKNKLQKIGFELLASSFLDDDNLSESQNTLSRMYRRFIFEKSIDIPLTPVYGEKSIDIPLTVVQQGESFQDINSSEKHFVEVKEVDTTKPVYLLEALKKAGYKSKNGTVDYIVKQFEERWENIPYKKLRERYGDFETAKKSLQEQKNWRPLKVLLEIADILKISIVIDDTRYGVVEPVYRLRSRGTKYII